MENLVKSGTKLFLKPERKFWAGKRVLVTGHTGFKGSWLTLWLNRLGAQITGIGLTPDTQPNLFHLASIERMLASHHIADIRDADGLKKIIKIVEPEIVFHLAAQPLVIPAYRDSLCTFSINILGTANLLDALRDLPSVRVAVMITTDKVYESQKEKFPFRETDPLGGHDPYSASKAASEIVIASYRKSFLEAQGVAVASARAGNVIGGGDWSRHRLIPDAVRAWANGEVMLVRHPEATRPWQHVLEPLSGYLCLAERLWEEPGLADSYNFGPETADAATVRYVLGLASAAYGSGDILCEDDKLGAFHESDWLTLEVARAWQRLGVTPRWELRQSVGRTMNWYRQLVSGVDAITLCSEDISFFENTARIVRS